MQLIKEKIMGLVWVAMAMKDKMKGNGHESNRSKKPEPQKKSESKGSSQTEVRSLIKNENGMTKCLMSFLEDKPEELVIFRRIVEESSDLYEKEHGKTESEISSLVPKSEELEKGFAESCKRLQDMGFSVEFDSSDSYLVVKQPNKSNSAKYEYSSVPKPLHVNGLVLSKGIVLRGENPYFERLKMFNIQNPHCEDELIKTQTEIDRLKSHKLRLKVSKSEKQHLDELETKLKTLQTLVEKKHKFEQQSDLYASLTKEQKSSLVEYFDREQALSELGRKVSTLRNKYLFEMGYGSTMGEAGQKFKNYISGFVSSTMAKLSPEESKKVEEVLNKVSEFVLSATPAEITEAMSFNKSLIDDSSLMKRAAIDNFSEQISRQVKEVLQQSEATAAKNRQF